MRRHPGGSGMGHVVAILFAAGLTLALGACKGGGGDSGSSPIPCTSLSFTPAISSASNGDVYLLQGSTSCSTVDVGVWITNVSGIFTVSFDLTYPASSVAYQSFVAGPVMSQGNPTNAPVFIVNNPSAGSLQVTMSRLHPDSSVQVTGAGLLITFRFAKVAAGTGTIDFDSSSSSLISEEIQDENGNQVAASFGPGHGGVVMVP